MCAKSTSGSSNIVGSGIAALKHKGHTMSMMKKSTCRQCGKKFSWIIQRPGDGHWDRWSNDDGETLANWFIENSLCWDHAYAVLPQKFAGIIKTLSYEEEA